MFEGRRILGLIPARTGSKGIFKKNIAPLAGKPLISYTIEAGLKSKYIDSVVVSTDGDEIVRIARDCGAEVPFLRPKSLSMDRTKTVEAVLHAIETLKLQGRCYDDLVLLQPTQPLRTNDEVDEAIKEYFEHGREGLVSVCRVRDHPLLIRTIDEASRAIPLLKEISTCRRQDMKQFYRVNGCIYINSIDSITQDLSFNDNPVGYVMDYEHSVDIDDAFDLEFAEWLLKRRNEFAFNMQHKHDK